MKNKNSHEMWKNALTQTDEKYIAEGAELAPESENIRISPANEKHGTGNLGFVFAAAAAVIVSFIGVGFFLKGTGIEPLSPSAGSVGASNTDDGISNSGTMTTTIIMNENGEIITGVSRSENTTAAEPVSSEQYQEWLREAEEIKEDYSRQIVLKQKEITECEKLIDELKKRLETEKFEDKSDYDEIRAELHVKEFELENLRLELEKLETDYNGQVLIIENYLKSYEQSSVEKQPLTMEKLKALVSAKGKELTWSDFEPFEGKDVGSGLYIMKYPIDEIWSLVIGGVPAEKPMYVNLTSYVDGKAFSISDNGAEGFEEFIRLVNENLNKKLLSLSQLEEISAKYDIPFDMLTDFEINVDNVKVYHDADKYFYPMYLIFESDNRLVINTTAKDTESQYPSGFVACLSVCFEKFTGKWERTMGYWYDDPTILKGKLYSQKEMPSEIVIPEGITEIGEGVFMDCNQIEKVTLPSTLKVIGKGAFKDCTNLKEINIPYGVTTIGERAFENCTSVYMVLPDTVTTIEDGAFAGCTQFDGTFKPTDFDPETMKPVTDGTVKCPVGETDDFTLVRPVDSTFITADYSGNIDKGHDGIDYAGEIGDNIYAAADGIVTAIETEYDDKGYGKYVIIDHGNGYTTCYAHLDSISVEMLDEVSQGDIIGRMGNTGWSTGPHLHFVLAENGEDIDPHIYLDDPIQLIHPTGDVYSEDDILFGYGEYDGHKGIDYAGEKGQNVAAAANGTISHAGWKDGYGNCVIIDHRNGYQTFYGHLDEIKVEAGETVTTGHLIGTMGSTGITTGVQLHFELLKDGENLNPADYMN